MLRRLIHFAMIGCLLGCPPSCWLNSAIAGGSSVPAADEGVAIAAHGSCGRCCCQRAALARTDAPRHRSGERSLIPSDTPTPCDDDGLGGPCQCICGGATLDGQVAFDAGDAAQLVDQLAFAGISTDLLATEADTAERWRPPDDDVLSGREICRLHSLMLC